MNKLYISNPALIRAIFVTVATKSISGRIQKQAVLMMLSFLLLSFNCFGQTIMSGQNGDWNAAGTWVEYTNGNNTRPAGRIPNASDEVLIQGSHTVTVSNELAVCKTLTIKGGKTGQATTAGIVAVGYNVQNAVSATDKATLTLATLILEVANGTPKENARLYIGEKGKLVIAGSIETDKNSNKFYYEFHPGSTVEYSSGTTALAQNQTIYNFPTLSPASNLNSGAYKNLVVGGSGEKSATANLRVDENFVTNAGASFLSSSFTHTISGNLLNAGTINAGSSTINIGGNFTSTINGINGTFYSGTGSVKYVTTAGTTNQQVAGVQYNNLEFSGSGTKTATGDMAVSNTVTVAGGNFIPQTHTFTYNGAVAQSIAGINYNNLTLANTGTKTAPTATVTVLNNLTNSSILYAGSGTIYIGGNFANTGTFHSATGTVVYNGATSDRTQQVAGVVYNHLQFAGISSKLASASLSANGNLQINEASNFNAGAFTHTITGNWTNDGSFTSGASTIILNGTQRTIKSTNGAFNNLTVSNGSKTLNSNVSVSGMLSLQNELYTGQSFALQLNGTGQLANAETATQYITGTVSAFRTIKSGSAAAPTVEPFGNIGISFTNTEAVTADVTINVTRTTGMSAEGIDGSKVSASRIYNITSGTLVAAPGLQASFSFLNREMSEVKDKYSLYVERAVDAALKYSSITSTYSSSPADHTYSISNVQRLGRYTIAAAPTPINPQPVELAWLKAQRQAQGVMLTWETASEEKNKGFEVQVSTNGRNFDKVAFVESKVVNSTVAQRYSYADNATVAYGTRYYRLVQVDLDGTTTYSKIVALHTNAAEVAPAAAYPNPFADGQQVTVRLPQDGESRSVSVVLTSMHGQVVFAQQAQVQNGQVELAVNTSGAGAKGIYLLNVIDNGTKHTFKLLKK